MSVLGTLSIVVVLAVLGVIIWRMIASRQTQTVYRPPNATVLVSGSISGKTTQTSGGDMPRSLNQDKGIAFSYACWILVNDYTVNYGTKRAIFTKDDCPGVYLDTTSNGILIAIQTYGAKETILIDNMPATKWIHFALTVNQDAADIYINGVLKQHHSLAQLPKQNTSPVSVGSSWDGVLANLYYFPLCLSSTDVEALAASVPTDDLKTKPASPPYFDMTWYTGRLTSQ